MKHSKNFDGETDLSQSNISLSNVKLLSQKRSCSISKTFDEHFTCEGCKAFVTLERIPIIPSEDNILEQQKHFRNNFVNNKELGYSRESAGQKIHNSEGATGRGCTSSTKEYQDDTLRMLEMKKDSVWKTYELRKQTRGECSVTNLSPFLPSKASFDPKINDDSFTFPCSFYESLEKPPSSPLVNTVSEITMEKNTIPEHQVETIAASFSDETSTKSAFKIINRSSSSCYKPGSLDSHKQQLEMNYKFAWAVTNDFQCCHSDKDTDENGNDLHHSNNNEPGHVNSDAVCQNFDHRGIRHIFDKEQTLSNENNLAAETIGGTKRQNSVNAYLDQCLHSDFASDSKDLIITQDHSLGLGIRISEVFSLKDKMQNRDTQNTCVHTQLEVVDASQQIPTNAVENEGCSISNQIFKDLSVIESKSTGKESRKPAIGETSEKKKTVEGCSISNQIFKDLSVSESKATRQESEKERKPVMGETSEKQNRVEGCSISNQIFKDLSVSESKVDGKESGKPIMGETSEEEKKPEDCSSKTSDGISESKTSKHENDDRVKEAIKRKSRGGSESSDSSETSDNTRINNKKSKQRRNNANGRFKSVYKEEAKQFTELDFRQTSDRIAFDLPGHNWLVARLLKENKVDIDSVKSDLERERTEAEEKKSPKSPKSTKKERKLSVKSRKRSFDQTDVDLTFDDSLPQSDTQCLGNSKENTKKICIEETQHVETKEDHSMENSSQTKSPKNPGKERKLSMKSRKRSFDQIDFVLTSNDSLPQSDSQCLGGSKKIARKVCLEETRHAETKEDNNIESSSQIDTESTVGSKPAQEKRSKNNVPCFRKENSEKKETPQQHDKSKGSGQVSPASPKSHPISDGNFVIVQSSDGRVITVQTSTQPSKPPTESKSNTSVDDGDKSLESVLSSSSSSSSTTSVSSRISARLNEIPKLPCLSPYNSGKSQALVPNSVSQTSVSSKRSSHVNEIPKSPCPPPYTPPVLFQSTSCAKNNMPANNMETTKSKSDTSVDDGEKPHTSAQASCSTTFGSSQISSHESEIPEVTHLYQHTPPISSPSTSHQSSNTKVSLNLEKVSVVESSGTTKLAIPKLPYLFPDSPPISFQSTSNTNSNTRVSPNLEDFSRVGSNNTGKPASTKLPFLSSDTPPVSFRSLTQASNNTTVSPNLQETSKVESSDTSKPTFTINSVNDEAEYSMKTSEEKTESQRQISSFSFQEDKATRSNTIPALVKNTITIPSLVKDLQTIPALVKELEKSTETPFSNLQKSLDGLAETLSTPIRINIKSAKDDLLNIHMKPDMTKSFDKPVDGSTISRIVHDAIDSQLRPAPKQSISLPETQKILGNRKSTSDIHHGSLATLIQLKKDSQPAGTNKAFTLSKNMQKIQKTDHDNMIHNANVSQHVPQMRPSSSSFHYHLHDHFIHEPPPLCSRNRNDHLEGYQTLRQNSAHTRVDIDGSIPQFFGEQRRTSFHTEMTPANQEVFKKRIPEQIIQDTTAGKQMNSLRSNHQSFRPASQVLPKAEPISPQWRGTTDNHTGPCNEFSARPLPMQPQANSVNVASGQNLNIMRLQRQASVRRQSTELEQKQLLIPKLQDSDPNSSYLNKLYEADVKRDNSVTPDVYSTSRTEVDFEMIQRTKIAAQVRPRLNDQALDTQKMLNQRSAELAMRKQTLVASMEDQRRGMQQAKSNIVFREAVGKPEQFHVVNHIQVQNRIKSEGKSYVDNEIPGIMMRQLVAHPSRPDHQVSVSTPSLRQNLVIGMAQLDGLARSSMQNEGCLDLRFNSQERITNSSSLHLTTHGNTQGAYKTSYTFHDASSTTIQRYLKREAGFPEQESQRVGPPISQRSSVSMFQLFILGGTGLFN